MASCRTSGSELKVATPRSDFTSNETAMLFISNSTPNAGSFESFLLLRKEFTS